MHGGVLFLALAGHEMHGVVLQALGPLAVLGSLAPAHPWLVGQVGGGHVALPVPLAPLWLPERPKPCLLIIQHMGFWLQFLPRTFARSFLLSFGARKAGKIGQRAGALLGCTVQMPPSPLPACCVEL